MESEYRVGVLLTIQDHILNARLVFVRNVPDRDENEHADQHRRDRINDRHDHRIYDNLVVVFVVRGERDDGTVRDTD